MRTVPVGVLALLLLWLYPGAAMAQRIRAPADRPVGQAFDLVQLAGPSLTAPGTLSGRLSSAALRGQIIVLDLWTPGCVPCGPTHEALTSIAPMFRDSGVAILSVGMVSDSASALEWVGQHGGPVIPVLRMDTAFGEANEVTSFPRLLIVDARGYVAYDGHPLGVAAFIPRVLPMLIAERDGRPLPRGNAVY